MRLQKARELAQRRKLQRQRGQEVSAADETSRRTENDDNDDPEENSEDLEDLEDDEEDSGGPRWRHVMLLRLQVGMLWIATKKAQVNKARKG